MQTQVITITPNGAISGLQHKPGKGVNLQSFGQAKTTRASLVEWDEDAQKWYVEIIEGPMKGERIDATMLGQLGMDPGADTRFRGWHVKLPGGVILFDNYDDGVEAEIAVLDEARRRGVF